MCSYTTVGTEGHGRPQGRVRVVVVLASYRRGLDRTSFRDHHRLDQAPLQHPEEAFLFLGMIAKLCVTVTGRTMAELRKRRDEVTDADLIELRVDLADDPSAAGALAGRRIPVIFTCRAAWEGGGFKGSEEERHRILAEAQQLGADYVDVEWKAGFDDLVSSDRGRGVVLSMHDFAGVPPDLGDRARSMRSSNAEVVKLAVMAHRLTDCLSLRAMTEPSDGRTVVIAMGDAGLASRVLATRFGSAWTYAGDGVAPGQLPAERLRREFAFDRVSDGNAVYGVVGRPVMHSLSPAMHNAAFEAAGLDAVYVPFAAADFDDFATFANALGIAGVSVTAPFKLAAFELASVRDPISERVGSANTLKRRDGQWSARNTDVAGFLEPLEARLRLAGRRATVLGAGGASRAVVEALASAGAGVTIAARDRRRAADLASHAGASVVDWPPAAGSWDVLINATPLGTAPDVDETPLPGGPFSGELVYDLVYNPLETRFLREARSAGCRTIGGLDMLVAQAERQFEWWTGQRPADGAMRQAALLALGKSTLGTLGTSGTLGTLGTLK